MTETNFASLLKASVNPAEHKLLFSLSRAIRFNVFLTNSESPPNDSKAMWINWTSLLAHYWEYCSKFLSSTALRAKPTFLDAFQIILGCSAEVMVISRAGGCPADQQGKYTSPGREFVSGIRFFYSQTGDRLATLQAEKNCPLGGRVAKSYRPAIDMQQHDHSVYRKILFFNRDTSFLFLIWECQVCTSQLHENRLARDGGREQVWECDNKGTFSLLHIWFSINLRRELPVFCFE